jgi:glycosyltransferase involved in cell wall biosynthesis
VASPHAGATVDLVTDGESGFVVEPDDRERFAAALSALASYPELRARIGAAAYERTRDRTPETTAGGYLRAVEAALMFKRRHGAREPAPT